MASKNKNLCNESCIKKKCSEETSDCSRFQNARTRKCSIVQEEEDEDDVSSCSGRDEHGNSGSLSSFNRRGSRSEGKLSHVLQERLAQLPEKSHVAPKAPLRHVHHLDVARTKEETSSPGHTFTVVRVGNLVPAARPSAQVVATENDASRSEKLSSSGSPTAGSISSGWSRRPLCSDPESRPKSVTECLSSPVPVPSNKWRMGSQHRASLSLSETKPKTAGSLDSTMPPETSTTILMESSTAPSPLRATAALGDSQILIPKYKTMPTGGSTTVVVNTPGQLPLNEILEDGDALETGSESGNTPKCRVVRRTGYEQRRSKFHKTRTTSCSSSDASDDDSEGRKKRAHKLGASTGKPLPSRRDSHDDSSDSQDPGGSGGGGRGLGNGETVQEAPRTDSGNGNNQSGGTSNTTTTTTTGAGGKVHRCTDNQAMSFGRRHRAGRRRAGETRLRESQSLNRITEVQEAEPPTCHAHSRNVATPHSVVSSSSSSSSSVSRNVTHIATSTTAQSAASTVQRAKGFGARLLQSMSLGGRSSTPPNEARHNGSSTNGKENSKKTGERRNEEKFVGTVGDEKNSKSQNGCPPAISCEKENVRGSVNRTECKSRKMRLLSRYFAVHKKLCVPLPGLFGKGRLYKARSCGNIARDRVSPPSPKSMLLCSAAEDKWRERKQWCDAKNRQQHRGSDGDINQNLGLAQLVQDSVVGKGCAGLPAICHIHLGDASKCCSLC